MSQYTAEELRLKANEARKVAIILGCEIYRYLGGEICKNDLKNTVDSLISEEFTKRWEHQYITKDFYEHIDNLLEDITTCDDTDSIKLIGDDS